MKKNQDIENIFQEAFESFSVKPDASVWANIQSQIPSAPAAGSLGTIAGKLSVFSKLIVGAAIVGGIAATAYFLSPSNEVATPTSQSESLLPLEQEENKPDPISINVEKDSLEHLSKEVEAEKIKEMEKILEPSAKKKVEKTEKESDNMISGDDKKELENIVAKENAPTKVDQGQKSFQEESESGNSILQDTEGTEQQNKQEDTELPQTDKIETVVEQGSEGNTVEGKLEEENEIARVIPNIFTPNQDGINDVFRIECEDADDLEVIIFDKKGQKVFEWKGLYGFWDGKLHNGELAPADNYFYKVILKKADHSTVENGSVLLKR